MSDQRTRCSEEEGGFTLIELMVVILIIGILIAIALPTFLGARERAADRAAQTNLRTGLAAALTHFTRSQSYSGFETEAETLEPTFDWLYQEDPEAGQIDIEIANGDELLLLATSSSGNYFCLAQVAGSPLTIRGRGSSYASVNDMTVCTGGW